MSRIGWLTWLLPVCALAGCEKSERAVLPPPLPIAVPPLPSVVDGSTGGERDETAPSVSRAPQSKVQAARKVREPRATASAVRKPATPAPPTRSESVKTARPAPNNAEPPARKPEPKRVTVPSTQHVRAEIPPGLQRDLDADPRMQPWLGRVIAIVDGCHASARGARGAIEGVITMHENDRPDVEVRSLPPQLASVVACATGGLLRTKMPLFTGGEGTRHVVRVVFE